MSYFHSLLIMTWIKTCTEKCYNYIGHYAFYTLCLILFTRFRKQLEILLQVRIDIQMIKLMDENTE